MKGVRKGCIPGIIIFIAAACFWTEAAYPSQKATVSSLVGEVKVIRDGKTINPAVGSAALEGDLYRIGIRSFVEFDVGRDQRIKVTGPRNFRIKGSHLAGEADKSNMFHRFYEKLTKDTRHPDFTVVASVRGPKGKDEGDEALRKEAVKVNRAIELFRKNRLDDSWKILEELSRNKELPLYFQGTVNFYRGEILFQRLDFDGALKEYETAYRTRSGKFTLKEDSLARAIICASYTENTVVLKDLLADYDSQYGDFGYYAESIKKIKKSLK